MPTRDPTRRPHLPYTHTLRVYWEDTDAGGIVFYANYLKFFERARTEWLRSLGFGQQQLKDARGLMFLVASTAVDYLSPARLDDELRVNATLDEAGRASMVIAQQAWCADRLLARGRIRIGCVDVGTLRPQRIPTDLIEAIG